MKVKTKTLLELNAMKKTFVNIRKKHELIPQDSLPIITAYEQFFYMLEDYFLYKQDGVNLISLELQKWDKPAQKAILGALNQRISNKEFTEEELLSLKIS